MADFNSVDYSAKREPAILDADCTRGDLIYALEQLRFDGKLDGRTGRPRPDILQTVQLDAEVRDFLVGALRRRA
jgi:hypothetical protein